MAEPIFNNPYEEGTIEHRDFASSLSHFNKESDDKLSKSLEMYKVRAQDLGFNDEQLDYYERECRAIQTIIDSRK
jgi:hypothetical protein